MLILNAAINQINQSDYCSALKNCFTQSIYLNKAHTFRAVCQSCGLAFTKLYIKLPLALKISIRTRMYVKKVCTILLLPAILLEYGI